MSTIGLFYGTSTGNTEEAARDIAAELRKRGFTVDLIDVCRMEPARLTEYRRILIGCPTWDIGELQGDWDRIHRKLGELTFENTRIALFGCGDIEGYPETFQDALGILGREFRKRGAQIIGLWPTEGYDPAACSGIGVEGDHFFGLALDYDNNHQACAGQIATWCEQLTTELTT